MDPNDNYPKERGFFSKIGYHVADFIQTLVVFGAVFALIYLFIAQPHKVSGNSMYPTFHNGDYILTDKLTYRFDSPKHADVIVLRNPRDESQDFIKRIIAIPGDSVMIQNSKVYLNGKQLNEDYLPPGTITQSGTFLQNGITYMLDSNQYFVMGDNRSHSSDSREWGTVTKQEIIGKTFFRYFPPERFGLFKPTP